MAAHCYLTRILITGCVILGLGACSDGSSGSAGGSAGHSSPYDGPDGHYDLPENVSILKDACENHDPDDGINRAAIGLSGEGGLANSPHVRMCQSLHQYGLFEANAADGFPHGDPRRPRVVDDEYQGLPYVLNTALFSDYTAKHRIVFLPVDETGITIPAQYYDSGINPDGEPGTGNLAMANANIAFPTGTVIAKTFTYPDISAPGGAIERVVETRLLIKHTNTSTGQPRWEGLSYLWVEDEENPGEWIAHNFHGGGDFDEARSWDYPDPNGSVQNIIGTVPAGEDKYQIPGRSSCTDCHRNADQDAGAAPIGLKARYLNRPYASEFSQFTEDPQDLIDRNQIDFWAEQGWLINVPDEYYEDDGVMVGMERIQPYNIPADPDNPADDLAARARGYLEVNCAHCHNQANGSVEDFYLELQRDFCSPNLYGQGNITAGNAGNSGLHNRINMPGDTSSTAMPRLARQLIHAEGVDVIHDWIENMSPDICN